MAVGHVAGTAGSVLLSEGHKGKPLLLWFIYFPLFVPCGSAAQNGILYWAPFFSLKLTSQCPLLLLLPVAQGTLPGSCHVPWMHPGTLIS